MRWAGSAPLLGSAFELGAIFELKPSLVPPFRGHARRGAVCSPLIVSRRPRAVGASPRDGGGTSGLTPARFDLDVAPQSRLNLDALSTNTRWSLQTRAVRHDTRVPTLSEISRTPRIVSFRSPLFVHDRSTVASESSFSQKTAVVKFFFAPVP